MRFLLRAIIFGILTGAMLFFFPFHFFLLPVLLVFLLLRIFFRPWRWRHRHHGFGDFRGYTRFAGYGSRPDDENGFLAVLPIDGFVPRRRGGNDKAGRNINIQ